MLSKPVKFPRIQSDHIRRLLNQAEIQVIDLEQAADILECPQGVALYVLDTLVLAGKLWEEPAENFVPDGKGSFYYTPDI